MLDEKSVVNRKDKSKGMLMGLAIGDALGMSVEFKTRGHFEEVVGYREGGPFNLPAGYWTDDTSMAICLADSIIEKGGYDSFDVMDKYTAWVSKGYRSSTGKCFDVGNQVSKAISRYRQNPIVSSGEEYVEAAGNGCVMRLAPVVIATIASNKNIYSNERYCMISARETHLSHVAEQATGLFGSFLYIAATEHEAKQKIINLVDKTLQNNKIIESWKNVLKKSVEDIKPTGYVVDTIEAALWAFLTTETFEQAVLKAVNLGGDADTIGAVCGQLAGAFYGLSGIPKKLVDGLFEHEEITTIAERLLNIRYFSFVRSRFEIDKSGPGYSDERAEEFEKMNSII